MRIVSYNIRYGGRGRESAIASVIAAAAPELVVFQEATDPGVVERIAGMTGMAAWGAQRGQSLGFLSRVAPDRAAWHWPRSSRHAYLELVTSGGALRIVGVHLSAVHAAWAERRRARELGALLSAIAPCRGEPHVLVGDFNSLAPGAELELKRLPPRLRPFVWLSGGRIPWRVVAGVLAAGYLDVAAQWDGAATPTFPTWGPHLRLDYAFVPDAFAPAIRGYRVLTDPPVVWQASDHLPILVELDPPSRPSLAPAGDTGFGGA